MSKRSQRSGELPIDAAEWDAQEQAMQQVRCAIRGTPVDARELQYGQIAVALRGEPAFTLPEGFARHVAIIALGKRQPVGFELFLLGLLVMLLLTCIGTLTAFRDTEWLHWFDGLGPIVSYANNPWLISLIACLGSSWVASRTHSRSTRLGR